MARQERLIRDWFAARARPGETYLGWGLLSKYPNPTINRAGNAVAAVRGEHRRAQRQAMVEQLGLDPGRRLLPGVTDPFAAVSDQRLVLGRQGGFRFTPKDELLSLERPAFRLLWWDETHPGPDERHVVIQVADGTWWDTSSVVHDGYNSAGFLHALGANAVQVGG